MGEGGLINMQIQKSKYKMMGGQRRVRPCLAREERLPKLKGARLRACPVSTEGWTRHVHFVREGGGEGDLLLPFHPYIALATLAQEVLRHMWRVTLAPRIPIVPTSALCASSGYPTGAHARGGDAPRLEIGDVSN